MKHNELLAHFTVKNGKPEWKSTEYLRVNLPTFEGCKGILQVKRKWNKRSGAQNAWMWKCFEVLAEYTGHSKNTIHDLCKGLYAPRKRVMVGKKDYTMPKGTSELSKGEMVEFMLEVNSLASSLGCILPNPEDYQRELDTAQLINE